MKLHMIQYTLVEIDITKEQYDIFSNLYKKYEKKIKD